MTTAVSSSGDVKPIPAKLSDIEQVVDTVSSEELAELSICESLDSGELPAKGMRQKERRGFFKLVFFVPF